MPRLLRRAAAFLASLALLAVPARGVLACGMASVTAVASSGEHHHVPTDVPTDARTDAPTEQQHPQCDHLVGCAPLALAGGAVLLPDIISSSALDVPFVADGAESPARALEPPPPKR
jgi:hypothetical protein